jgi:RHH-type proline utilization regulon transcriptional repressor/proline dehydrogenase/delta 1-pyrroline-5-carboxylate dehydrogenase
VSLQSPAGEQNRLSLHGRGVWLCISPWNFPLAIFAGQIAAALVCGNAVIAKPAEQSCAIAAWAIDLAHASGVPASALHLMPAQREAAHSWLTHPAIAGVSFTGSNRTAKQLRQDIAQRDGPQIPLIAETGGMNAMIVDSTALPEQAVEHIVSSAFNMAGQRCSALRVLYVQQDIAETLLARLKGRIQQMNCSAPDVLSCDVPPLIDSTAHQRLQTAWNALAASGQVVVEPHWKLVHQGTQTLHTCTPGVVRMDTPHVHEEIFGPILQVCTFPADGFRDVVDTIAQWGWGLTVGLQSRIDERIAHLADLPVGNAYINRPMIGAVVGVQPFGGCGLSGTGPKAGGPHSLIPYCTERLCSVNTAAAGGVMELLTLPADPIKIANRFDKE